MTKSKWMKGVEYIARMMQIRNEYTILAGKPPEQRLLGG
jgi:hypothetical protein